MPKLGCEPETSRVLPKLLNQLIYKSYLDSRKFIFLPPKPTRWFWVASSLKKSYKKITPLPCFLLSKCEEKKWEKTKILTPMQSWFVYFFSSHFDNKKHGKGGIFLDPPWHGACLKQTRQGGVWHGVWLRKTRSLASSNSPSYKAARPADCHNEHLNQLPFETKLPLIFVKYFRKRKPSKIKDKRAGWAPVTVLTGKLSW